MDNVHSTDCSSPLIDLTSHATPRRNHTAPNIDLTGSDDKGTNFSPEIIDLTDEIQHFYSNIPVIDLTCDNDRSLNYRIPVIDLTNDDFSDITHQKQCIDLTYNDASNSNPTADGNQYLNPNTPLIDLTCDNDQLPNSKIQVIDMTNDDVQDIIKQLQSFDLKDGKQQNVNECIPSISLTNHSYQSIDRIVSANHLASHKYCNNFRRPIIDLIQNDNRVIRKPVDAEIYDLSYDNAPTCFQNGAIENNLKIQAANLNYIATKNDFFKCNETSSMNVMHNNTFSSMEKFYHQKEILENNPLKNDFEDRSKTVLTNHPLRNNFENRKERILINNQQTNISEGRKEKVLTHYLQTNNPEEKYLKQKKFKKSSHSNTSDFLKPAYYPIPLRHSLGKSTINTSPNTSIECTEGSENQSRILTVSSIIRRKKSKSNPVISEHALLKSKKQTALRENTFSFETFKGFLRKFWIFLLLTFIGLYYWF